MRKETLEEAAEKSTNIPNLTWENEYAYNKFLEGAKWQQEQQDKFAIGFAEWRVNDWVYDERWTKISDIKEILEIYKIEKGL